MYVNFARKSHVRSNQYFNLNTYDYTLLVCTRKPYVISPFRFAGFPIPPSAIDFHIEDDIQYPT